MSKGGSTTSTVAVPEYIEKAAKRNLNKAEGISQIGYTPYYGADVAAFTPMQQAAFQNTADTAGAFGTAGGNMSQQDIRGGMSEPTTFAGGVRGYSSAPMYEQSLEALAAARPGQKEYIDNFFIDPYTGRAGSNVQAPIDYEQYNTIADITAAQQASDLAIAQAQAGGGGDTYSPPVFTPPPIDVPFTPGPVNKGLPTTLNDGSVYTSTGFAGAEAPYTIVTPTDVRPPGYVDDTPSTFTELQQYYDSSPITGGGPAIMYNSDGTETNLGFDLGPSVEGGRGTIVPGQTTTQIGIPGNFSPDPSNVGDLLISVHGFTPEEAIASGYEPSFVSNPGTVNPPSETDIASGSNSGLLSGGGADNQGNFGQVGDFFGKIGDSLGFTNFDGSNPPAGGTYTAPAALTPAQIANAAGSLNPFGGTGPVIGDPTSMTDLRTIGSNSSLGVNTSDKAITGAVSDDGNWQEVVNPGTNAITRTWVGDNNNDSNDKPSSNSDCVVATHAVGSGAFTPNTKREAVVWCMNVLHGKWWGEAIRRGYRYLGRSKIEQGKAHEHYQEFRNYIAFASGKKRTIKGAIHFVARTGQFFAIGLIKRNV